MQRSEHFPLGDHFINSQNLFFWLCTDIVLRKLMLVALRTSRKLNNCFMHQHDYMINEACKKYGELKRCVSQSADESSSSLLCALETSQKLHSLTMQSCFITISLQQFTSLCFHVSLILFEKILWYASMIRQKLTSELVHKWLFFFSQF